MKSGDGKSQIRYIIVIKNFFLAIRLLSKTITFGLKYVIFHTRNFLLTSSGATKQAIGGKRSIS